MSKHFSSQSLELLQLLTCSETISERFLTNRSGVYIAKRVTFTLNRELWWHLLNCWVWTAITKYMNYRWVLLKPDFLGAWKSVRLKHYLAYPVIIVSLIIQKNLATKIWAMRESGLTTVRLKQDPPVCCPFDASHLWEVWIDLYEQILEVWSTSLTSVDEFKL